jgi:hypothetical protein
MKPTQSQESTFAAISDLDLAHAVGGGEGYDDQVDGEGSQVNSTPRPEGGVEIDWKDKNNRIPWSPLDGVFKTPQGDGTNGEGGWGIG